MKRWRKNVGGIRARGTEQGWYIDKSRVDFHLTSRAESVGRRPGKLLLYVSVGRNGNYLRIWRVTDHHAHHGARVLPISPTTTTELTTPIRRRVRICRGCVRMSVVWRERCLCE